MFRSLYRASIWTPGAIPEEDQKYAGPLKWVVFPLFDVVVVLIGIGGLNAGFQALRLTFPDPVPAVLYGVLVTVGVVAFAGAAFPRLWVVETVGKVIILIALAVLLSAMLVAAREIPGHSGLAVAPMIGGLMLIPFLRLWILAKEWAGRR